MLRYLRHCRNRTANEACARGRGSMANSELPDVRSGLKAGVAAFSGHVRLIPESGHSCAFNEDAPEGLSSIPRARKRGCRTNSAAAFEQAALEIERGCRGAVRREELAGKPARPRADRIVGRGFSRARPRSHARSSPDYPARRASRCAVPRVRSAERERIRGIAPTFAAITGRPIAIASAAASGNAGGAICGTATKSVAR